MGNHIKTKGFTLCAVRVIIENSLKIAGALR